MSQESQTTTVDTITTDDPQSTNQPQTTQTQDPIDPALIARNAQGAAYGNIDAVMAELGFEKPAGVKTSEWVKKVYSEKLVQQQQTKEPTTNEPNEWELKAKALQKKLEERETETRNLEQQFFQKQAEITLTSTLDALNIQAPPTLEPQMQEKYLQAQKSTLKNLFSSDYEAKVVSGQVVYYNKSTNEPELNARGEYATPKEIINKSYDAFLIDYSTKRGANIPDASTTNSKRLKTTADIQSHIAKEYSHFSIGSREYLNKFNELAKENNIVV